MSNFQLENHVIARNQIGQFADACSAAATASVRDAAERGVQYAKANAPVGPKHDKRTATLQDSFYVEQISRTQVKFGNSARHAMAQEFGARPHEIPGNPFLRFYWEEAGRMWVPGLFGDQDIVNHPGNPAQPFMRPAYRRVMQEFMDIVRRHYPGGRHV